MKGDSVESLFGPLGVLLLPERLMADIRTICRALLAWDYGFSPDQVGLLELVARGLTNDEIAATLNVAEIKTVKNRLQAVFDALGVKNRTDAAAVVAAYGLIDQQRVRSPQKKA